MSVPAKLAGFALVLIATFGAAFGVGRAVGERDDAPAPAAGTPSPATTTTTMDPAHGGHS